MALFHATRLLPHEEGAVRREGLVTLSTEHRNARLDQVIATYGEEVGVERLEALRHAGPLSWDVHGHSARLGALHGVTPLRDSFAEAGHGITVLLESWGGESFYGAASETEDLKGAIRALTARSRPVIVSLAVSPTTLNTFAHLWQVFVAQLHRWKSPWQEFHSRESVPPERALAMIGESSSQWPPDLVPLRTR